MKRVWIVGIAVALAGTLLACSDDDDDGGGLNKAAYCAKCAECFYGSSSFQEGFCDSFWDGSSFDQARCEKDAETAEADTKSLSSGELEGMSCDEFDEAI